LILIIIYVHVYTYVHVPTKQYNGICRTNNNILDYQNEHTRVVISGWTLVGVGSISIGVWSSGTTSCSSDWAVCRILEPSLYNNRKHPSILEIKIEKLKVDEIL